MKTLVLSSLKCMTTPLLAMGDTVGQGVLAAVVAIGLQVTTYLAPSKNVGDVIVACMAMVALDTITGVAAAIRTGTPVKSSELSRVVPKTIGYFASLAAITIALKSARVPVEGMELIISTVGGIYIANEMWSIIENADKCGAKTGKKIKRILHGVIKDQTSDIAEPYSSAKKPD